MMIDAILFYVFAAIAVASAVVVIAQRNPMYSAFALVVTTARSPSSSGSSAHPSSRPCR